MNDLEKKSIECIKNMPIEETTYQVARNVVLDYITNLQEQLHQASLDIQELTERDIECPSWCDKLTNLQQENERLKNELEWWKQQCDDLEMQAGVDYE